MRHGFAPAFNPPAGIAHRDPVDSGIGNRVSARRFRRQAMHLPVDDIEHAAVGNDNDALTAVFEMQGRHASQYPRMVLALAFAFQRHMIGVAPPQGKRLLGKPGFEFGQRQPFATTEIALAQLTPKRHGQLQRLCNRLRRLSRSQQVAAVQSIHRPPRKIPTNDCRLRQSFGVKWNIDMPLHAQFDIPVRFAMTDKTDSRHLPHKKHHKPQIQQ